MGKSAGTPFSIVIRNAVPGDLDALEALEDAVFDSDKLSRRSLRYYIGAAKAAFLVLERDTLIVGDAIVAFRQGSSHARLYSIAIDPRMTGHGFGGQLLRHCEAESRARGATHLRLEVRADNSRALGLYRKAGYTAFGRHRDYYEDGADAVRLEKRLSLRPSTGREGPSR